MSLPLLVTTMQLFSTAIITPSDAFTSSMELNAVTTSTSSEGILLKPFAEVASTV